MVNRWNKHLYLCTHSTVRYESAGREYKRVNGRLPKSIRAHCGAVDPTVEEGTELPLHVKEIFSACRLCEILIGHHATEKAAIAMIWSKLSSDILAARATGRPHFAATSGSDGLVAAEASLYLLLTDWANWSNLALSSFDSFFLYSFIQAWTSDCLSDLGQF